MVIKLSEIMIAVILYHSSVWNFLSQALYSNYGDFQQRE